MEKKEEIKKALKGISKPEEAPGNIVYKLTKAFPVDEDGSFTEDEVANFMGEQIGYLPKDLRNWEEKSKEKREKIIKERRVFPFLERVEEELSRILAKDLYEDWEEFAKEVLDPLWKLCLGLNKERAIKIFRETYVDIFPETKGIFRSEIERIWEVRKIEMAKIIDIPTRVPELIKGLPKSPSKFPNWFKKHTYPEDKETLLKQRIALGAFGFALDMLRFIKKES